MTTRTFITADRILDAVNRSIFTLDNPGFCIACGADHDHCEPDARNYECPICGEHEVFGAAELLLGATT